MNIFHKNLQEYKPFEIEAANRITAKYDTKIKKFNNDYRYDFKTFNGIKYEVKSEPASLKTNNLFIEFHGYGKPSGISISESNFYIINDTINYYLIDTNILKQLLKDNTFKIISTKDKLTWGYLVNKDIIIKHSIQI